MGVPLVGKVEINYISFPTLSKNKNDKVGRMMLLN